MRFRTLAAATIAMAALGLAFVATPAQADAQPLHCVVDVAAKSAAPTCYDSFTKAIAKATGGRVTDAPNNARAAIQDQGLTAKLNATGATKDRASVAVDVLIGIEYWDDDFGGSTYTFTAPWGCTGTTSDVDWEFAALPSNWNDEIGSYRGYSNCWVKHYEHSYFGGISTSYDGGLADMGWMDDETSSLRWS
ncbi:hypothetical protein AB0J90_06475 [Micromonospora sp. NPDC049523]|uniref:hypothetical protein n=1 Tax=Micromonospora sp. NPDC049523 TaxID=3155921 RepID=UPI00343DDB88